MIKIDSKTPDGTLSSKWTNHKSKINLVSPANKRLIDVIVVGTGLAGASASATVVAAEGVKAVNNVESKVWDMSKLFGGIGKAMAIARATGGKMAEANNDLSSP